MPVVSSKEAANYTPDGSPSEHCSICLHWFVGTIPSAEGTCQIVAGSINPSGWCRYFRHLPEAA